MIDLFALLSGFLILCVAALIAHTIRRIVPAALIIGTIAILGAFAAVHFGLSEELAPLLVIYVNGALMGGLIGFLFARRSDEERDATGE